MDFLSTGYTLASLSITAFPPLQVKIYRFEQEAVSSPACLLKIP